MPSGRLVHVEDRPGALADIYLHTLHVREPLVWELNWITRHQVGNGLWQQRWTHPGRMQEPAKGLGVAVSRWEIVPGVTMPRGRTVMPVEEDGSCIWLIRAGYCTRSVRDEMNAMLERIAGDGLWLQRWDDRCVRPPAPDPVPVLAPPVVPLSL
ncbi:hypothetical protein [Streptomyces sp. NPDC048392]|uniref:hypothetical protein n=1 Tax=Streptomyces sp. NPDC048392 TaxID=3365543 RepID=UPI00371CECDA